MTSLQEQARALGDPTRHAIFRFVADSPAPVGVAEINERFPLNHNAIRQHLAKLVAAGLLGEATDASRGRGRPRLVYAVEPAVEGQWGTAGPYEKLAQLLVQIITSGLDPEEVGRRAAGQFRVPSPSGDVVADVAAAMARQGFDPEVRPVRDGAEIVLRTCPFATAAMADRHTVCSLHLGIARGLTDGTDVVVDELVAYDPRTADCRLRIRVAPDDGRAAARDATLALRGRPRPR